MTDALIIFVRHPQLGKVKTRLAATIGNVAALDVYKKLLAHTFQISQKARADKFIFYAGEIVEDDMWSVENYFKLRQADSYLGGKMLSAFLQVLDKGYQNVCIIGSDCYELSTTIVDAAFAALNHVDVVVGPATDGGYYLLGMKEMHKGIFENKNWSSETVFTETVQSIIEAELTYQTLPALNDVDEEKDLPEEWRL